MRMELVDHTDNWRVVHYVAGRSAAWRTAEGVS